MLRYPIVLKEDGTGAVMVEFPDFPRVHTYGDGRDDAPHRALGAVETGIIALMADREDIPDPSPRRGRPVVTLGTQATMKVHLYRAMRAAGVRNAALARRLGATPTEVGRLLDLRHNSRIAKLDEALRVLGKSYDVRLRDAA